MCWNWAVHLCYFSFSRRWEKNKITWMTFHHTFNATALSWRRLGAVMPPVRRHLSVIKSFLWRPGSRVLEFLVINSLPTSGVSVRVTMVDLRDSWTCDQAWGHLSFYGRRQHTRLQSFNWWDSYRQHQTKNKPSSLIFLSMICAGGGWVIKGHLSQAHTRLFKDWIFLSTVAH